jgi:hypothetical protein
LPKVSKPALPEHRFSANGIRYVGIVYSLCPNASSASATVISMRIMHQDHCHQIKPLKNNQQDGPSIITMESSPCCEL